MKHCNNSNNCEYGHAFRKNVCGYDENLNDCDFCPYLLENWDFIVDRMFKEEIERGGDNATPE